MTGERDLYRVLGDVEGTLRAVQNDVSEIKEGVMRKHVDHERRLGSLERSRALLVGAVVAAKAGLAGLAAYVLDGPGGG